MQFGLVTDGGILPGRPENMVERYDQVVREAVAAEEAGFDVFGTSETHMFKPLTTISAPDVLFGAIAARTERLRLRYTAMTMPFHHPLFAAERLATLDVVSNGRAELGTARGNNPKMFQVLGIDSSRTRDMWEESIRIIAALHTQDEVTYHGEFSDLEDVFCFPRPVQTPMPFWSVATGLESQEMTGKLGMGVIAWDGYFGWRYLGDCYTAYRKGLEKAEPVNGEVNDRFSYFATATICKEDGAEARRLIEPRAFDFVDLILRVYGKLAANPTYEYYEELRTVEKHRRDLDVLMDHGPSVIAGDPDEVIVVLQRLQAMGVDEVMLSIDGISHEEHLETIRLFGKYVIPALNASAAGSGRADARA
jgi:alkanesulfonate monooxygenase SsuD/methylene tetrahydromethanopterin reductase-like flavin-dependent oxidoreductase (luciferase family)